MYDEAREVERDNFNAARERDRREDDEDHPKVQPPSCGRGWDRRCALAKSATCRCKCGGRNHGNQSRLTTTLSKRTERYEVPHQFAMYRPDLRGKFVGFRIDGRPLVYWDGVWLDPAPSIKMINHSPDGFEWGYAGSGCAQLSLAVCLKWLSVEESRAYYQQFKSEVISRLPEDHFELAVEEIKLILNKIAS